MPFMLDDFSNHHHDATHHDTAFTCSRVFVGERAKAPCPGNVVPIKVSGDMAVPFGQNPQANCGMQPPACCEAARRAEEAARIIENLINGEGFFSKMGSRLKGFIPFTSGMPLPMLIVGPPPHVLQKESSTDKDKNFL